MILLFIDDDPDVLRALGNYFERLGHTVHRAQSGKEGLALWERVRPDVTVLDLHMPEVTGMEVLTILRAKRAMVVMLTAYGDVTSAVEAMKLGAEHFLVKPVEMSHLQQVLEKAAEKGALRRELADLRRHLAPNTLKRLLRVLLLLALIAASVALGRLIGRPSEEVRPREPIPIPLDTTPLPDSSAT